MKRQLGMFALCASLATASLAHEGHDHGDETKRFVIPGNAPQRLPDGNVFLPGETGLKPGDKVRVRIVEAEEYDLIGERI